MKKLTIIMCLLLLNIALNNVRSYASFVYDIDMFEQYDGTDTFTDTFSDDVEPPSGSISGSDYDVEGTFAPNREKIVIGKRMKKVPMNLNGSYLSGLVVLQVFQR